MIIGVCGVGFVGTAIKQCFEQKNFKVVCYDKYNNIGSFYDLLHTNILFLALPTPFDTIINEYDKTAIMNTLLLLNENNYNGCIVIKSTIEPGTTRKYISMYPNLDIIHNPEFLSAKTAGYDFMNQSHIIIGHENSRQVNLLINIYENHFTNNISLCSTIESESVKLFCNSFYAVKVQYFTELYLLCQKNGTDYELIKNMMLKNNWIHPNHTNVPGSDGHISYGGACFPKDTMALAAYMDTLNTNNKVLKSTIEERNSMRKY